MARGGSIWASRLVRGGFTLLSLTVLGLGTVAFLRGGPAPAESQRSQTERRDSDLAAYGARISVPQGALTTVRQFIPAAVLRRDLERAWELSAPSLKSGLTKSEWLAGTIPVMPSPPAVFRHTSFGVARARERDVLLIVNDEFFVELVPSGRRWLVTYWAPRGHTGPVPAVP